MTKIPPMPEELRFDHEAHVRLWNWLAENPERDKYDWPWWQKYGDVNSQCFACEAVAKIQNWAEAHDVFIEKQSCDLCPLTWGEYPHCQTQRGEGIFDRWRQVAYLPRSRASFARQIRDLPVNDNIERAWQEIQEALRRDTLDAEGGDA